MLATKQYLTSMYEMVYGPYVKQVDQIYAVEGAESRSMIQVYDLQAAKAGLSLGSVHVALVGELHCLKVPSSAKVEVLGTWGWKTLWDGALAAPAADTMEVLVPSRKTVRILCPTGAPHDSSRPHADHTITLGLRRGKDSGRGTPLDLKNTFGWGLRGISSMLAHILFFAALIYLRGFEFPWNAETITLDSLKEVEKSMVEVTPTQLTGFDGGGIAIGSGPARGGNPTAVSASRASAVSSGLSGIASRLAHINFGSGSLALNVGGGKDDGKAMASVQAGLSKSQGSSLNSGLEKMAQGVIGKNMKWGLYGNNGQTVSLREQEEVANIFRALQAEFRGCYESALLKDADLSAMVNYEATIMEAGTLDGGSYDFSGTATADGQKHLTDCLSNVLKRVKVSRSLNGVKIKNQFIFKS